MSLLNARLEFGNRAQIAALREEGFYDFKATDEVKEFVVEKDCGGAYYCQTVYARTEEEAIEKAVSCGSWILAIDEEDIKYDKLKEPQYYAEEVA